VNALARTLSDLVAIDSVSARPNAEIIRYLREAVTRLGFEVSELGYDDDKGVRKTNLIAVAGPKQAVVGQGGLALVGHTDTVPYDASWAEALTLEERDGNLFGRGAADTKGFIASALAAASGVKLAGLKKPLCLVFTADEELGCVGARHLLTHHALSPAVAVVGEPTMLQPIRAHKGYCLAEIEVEGREAHSAFPQLGHSAILRAGKVLQAIERLGDVVRAQVDPLFDPAFTTFNVGMIQGGKAKNIVAGLCRITFEWRPIPGQAPGYVQGLLEKELPTVQRETGGLPIRLNVLRTDAGVATSPDAAVVRFFEKETGKPSQTIPFGTELPQMTALGAEGVVFGPGDIREAHKTGEFVPAAELDQAAAILTRAINHFCG
jgi:acetylornithine deacetylase